MSLDVAQLGALPAEALAQLFTDAHSVETFSDDPVEVSDVAAAYELAKWAPTQMNISPLRIAAVPRGSARERLVSHMTPGNQPKTLAAPMTIIAAADLRFHDHLQTLAPFREGLADRLEGELDNRTSMARNNTWIQIGSLMVALRARGLSIGPMGGFDAAGVDTEFFHNSWWRSQLVINVGWTPDDVRPRQGRLESDTAIAVL